MKNLYLICNNKKIKYILDIVVVEVVLFLTGLLNIVVATTMNGVNTINMIIMVVTMVESLNWQH